MLFPCVYCFLDILILYFDNVLVFILIYRRTAGQIMYTRSAYILLSPNFYACRNTSILSKLVMFFIKIIFTWHEENFVVFIFIYTPETFQVLKQSGLVSYLLFCKSNTHVSLKGLLQHKFNKTLSFTSLHKTKWDIT